MSKPVTHISLPGCVGSAGVSYEFGLTDLRPTDRRLQSYACRFAKPFERTADPLVDLMLISAVLKFLAHHIEVDRTFAAPVNLAHQPTIQIGVSSSDVLAERSERVDALRQRQHIGPYHFRTVVFEALGPADYYYQEFGERRFVAKHLLRALRALNPASSNDSTGSADYTPNEPKNIRWISSVPGGNVCACREEAGGRACENDLESVGFCHCDAVAGGKGEVQPS